MHFRCTPPESGLRAEQRHTPAHLLLSTGITPNIVCRTEWETPTSGVSPPLAFAFLVQTRRRGFLCFLCERTENWANRNRFVFFRLCLRRPDFLIFVLCRPLYFLASSFAAVTVSCPRPLSTPILLCPSVSVLSPSLFLCRPQSLPLSFVVPSLSSSHPFPLGKRNAAFPPAKYVYARTNAVGVVVKDLA